ncbi:cyclin-dependent kinase 20 isoform X5 [Vulpes lagopus]|uniref:cyclin-dependent kinase 20 isoform X5 n=1 Tax=Vulpes lagopus TaxID=494514 RepID=UPI001BCA434D|nr:cyclin-dependent kinase 20 isoform X5 [Vulpes lagopus]
MDQYCILGRIGEGAHGIVFKAKHVETGEIVALKKVALRRLEDGIPNQALREIKALQEIEDNQHVVQLKAVFPHGAGFVLAFEFMLSDLAEVVRHAQRPLVQAQVKSYLQMLLKGVAFCHANNIVHRDLKPANLLISASGQLKIADFGLARVFSPDGSRLYTHQVATRWYRAPELLYGARQYDQGVDLWAVGCILGELLNGSPLFPGENDIEQLCCVLRILGTPSPQVWPVCRSSWSRRLCPWRRCCPMRLPRPWTCWGGSFSTPHTSAFLPPRPSCTSTSSQLPCLPTPRNCRFPSAQGDLPPKPTQGRPTSMTSVWTGLSKSRC